MNMGTSTDAALDRLSTELAQLNKETRELTRNYSIAEAFAMEDGTVRKGAAAN